MTRFFVVRAAFNTNTPRSLLTADANAAHCAKDWEGFNAREREGVKREGGRERETGVRDEKRRAIVAANVIALTVIKASERVN